MTTTIQSRPDGRWELLRVYDTLTQAADAATILLADQWPDERVELAEPPWDGKWRKGDEGLTRGGWTYIVTRTDADYVTTPDAIQRIAARHEHHTTPGVGHHCDDGRFWGDGRSSTWDLMPPTKRGPSNAN